MWQGTEGGPRPTAREEPGPQSANQEGTEPAYDHVSLGADPSPVTLSEMPAQGHRDCWLLRAWGGGPALAHGRREAVNICCPKVTSLSSCSGS